jgi:MSHA biogenesis protein MshQ
VVVNTLPVDLDGTTLPFATAVGAATTLRYGQLRLSNVLGPDTRDLRMPMETQFWNGTSFVRNYDDSCTTVAGSAWSFGNYVKRPAGVVFSPVAADTTLVGGGGSLLIAKPAGGRITFDASINLASTGAETASSSCLKNLSLASPTRPWAPLVTTPVPSPVRTSLAHLAGQWCDATPTNNPSARGSFGLYRGVDSMVYQRERY